MSWTLQQVAEHNNAQSCWVIIQSKVYDVTDFLPEHPGGQQIILKYAGRDATAAYVPIHPSDALEKNIPPNKHLGDLAHEAKETLKDEEQRREKTLDEGRVEKALRRRPPLKYMLSLQDIEDVARTVLPYKALAYYSSGADGEVSDRENARAFSRFFFHPRVLRRVSTCDTSTRLLGHWSSIPVFISSAGLAKLGHPDGEANLARAAHHTRIIQLVSSNASLSYSAIASSRPSTPAPPLFFQLYKHRDHSRAEARLREITELGYAAVFLTVDAIVAGHRPRDVKSPWVLESMEREGRRKGGDGEGEWHVDDPQTLEAEEVSGEGMAGALVANDDRDMTWEETIPWLRSVTKLPIVIKGIQSVADAVLAAEAGVDGILISNHGGRQLDYALPSIEVLYRLRVQRPDVFDKVEVYMDGGARRGTDVLKALCLGATAVGMGRPFLYAQSAYGAQGVVKAVRILEREISAGMRFLGATSVKELVPEMVERVDWTPKLPAKL